MNFDDYLDPLIRHLKMLHKDENAVPFFDLMSGAFIWSDEKVRGLSVSEMGCLRGIFRYRTSLIVQEADPRFQSLWNKLNEGCPDWIGFDVQRCAPNEDLARRYKDIRKKPIF